MPEWDFGIPTEGMKDPFKKTEEGRYSRFLDMVSKPPESELLLRMILNEIQGLRRDIVALARKSK